MTRFQKARRQRCSMVEHPTVPLTCAIRDASRGARRHMERKFARERQPCRAQQRMEHAQRKRQPSRLISEAMLQMQVVSWQAGAALSPVSAACQTLFVVLYSSPPTSSNAFA